MISLDDAAYDRLKAWQRDSRESFSSVVKRVMPVRGSLGTLLDFVEANATGKLPGNELMEKSISSQLHFQPIEGLELEVLEP